LAAAAGFTRFGVTRFFRGAAVLDFARFGMARVGRTITVAVSNFKREVSRARQIRAVHTTGMLFPEMKVSWINYSGTTSSMFTPRCE
jgi:hypothetical protein